MRALPSLRLIALAALAGLAPACTSIAETAGPLPEAFRTTQGELGGRAYPQLSSVPAVPTDLPDGRTWRQLQTDLGVTGRTLNADPGARPATADMVEMASLRTVGRQINADPRSEPAAATQAEDLEWAQAERARMEALLQQLPPVTGLSRP
jgi:hypothetical protein